MALINGQVCQLILFNVAAKALLYQWKVLLANQWEGIIRIRNVVAYTYWHHIDV
jgi:hypothetical protein